RHGAGITVPARNVPALASAIDALATDRARRLAIADRCRALARTLTWSRVAAPLLRFCEAPYRAADLARRPRSEAAPLPLIADPERARRMALSDDPASGSAADSFNDRTRLVAERDAALELVSTLQNMKVFRYTKWPRAAYGALVRLGRRR